MTTTARRRHAWRVTPAPVGSAAALALLREYHVEVSDRWYLLHRGRRSTAAEIEEGLAGSPSDHLAPPAGVFLLARYGGEPAGCAGLRLLDARTAELTRVYVRPERRGTGGGTRLLAAAEGAARALGVAHMVLDTRLDLVEARALYTGHGYAETPVYKDDRYAEVCYAKELGPGPGPGG